MPRPGTSSSSETSPRAGSTPWPRRPWGIAARGVAPTCEPPGDPEVLGMLSPPAARGPTAGRLLLRPAPPGPQTPLAPLQAGRSLLVGAGRAALSRAGGRERARYGVVLDRDARRVRSADR